MADSVERTERGLVVAGTRITLYQILDYLEAGWTPERIASHHRLDLVMVASVLSWMDQHRDMLARENAMVIEQSKKNRAYWEEKNRAVLSRRMDKDALKAEIERRYGVRSA